MRSEGLRQLLDLMPVLVVFVDGRGSPGWANRVFRDLFRIKDNAAIREGIATFFPGLHDDILTLITEVLESGMSKKGIVTAVDIPDAGTKTLKMDILPCANTPGEPGWVILFAIDITEQSELERLKKNAFEQIEKNIEQFATLGDHIRNPVAVITGLCDLLEDRKTADKLLAQAREIDRIVTLIDQGWIESEKVRNVIKKYYDVGVSGTHELVARAIHEEYLLHQKAAGHSPETNSSMRPWAELSRSLQESNLRQADDIWKKLNLIHCGIALMVDNKPAQFEFSTDEIELLATYEHERWMQEQIRRGWTYGSVVNVRERTHNCLVPWRELTEEQREKDRNTIRTLPSVLAKVRLKIVRFQ
ncbi:MAG: sensory histidine kinase AtoS [Methanoregula sp. PtaU1.Bin051]|nr:MAG: sensory histidine kinase AtoS [Methanoregula sp. PtaU1.Bin051]